MLDANRADDAREMSADSGEINLDLASMKFLQKRLSLMDMGHLAVQIARAAAARRPSQLQRLLLAIVRHHEVGDE